jgi:flagellar biosynthesis GTPase FlhF
MDEQNKQRMKVHWKRGLDHFQSFFTLLSEVREEVGNNALPGWCLNDLGIGFSRVTQIAKCLREDDRLRISQELAQSRAADRAQRAVRRQEQERQRQEERNRRQEEERQRQAERARLQREREDREREARREARRVRRNEYERNRRQRRRDDAATVMSMITPASSSTATPNLPTGLSSSELARSIKAAIRRRDEGRSEWIEGSIELAGFLIQARESYRSDNQFGEWLRENDININSHDRAALVNLGSNLQAMRQVLERSVRSSYQLIWEDVRAQLPAT